MALPIKYSTGGLIHPALKKGDLAVGIGSVGYAGIFKNALDFDGSNDYVDFTPITTGTTWCLSFWFQYNPGVLISTATQDKVQIYNPTNIRITTGANDNFYSPPAMSTSTWYHCYISVTSGVCRLYFNGVLTTTGTQNNSIDITSFANYPGGGYKFGGILDEVGLLVGDGGTAQDAVDLYNGGSGDYFNTVMGNSTAYWRFNETSGTTLTDETGNYNGTLNNFTLPGAWVIANHTQQYQNSIELPSNGSYINGYTISTLDSSFNYHTFPITHDSQLVITANSLGGTSTTPTEAKVYLAGRSNTFILNNTPPNIVTSGSVLNLDGNNLSSYPTSGTIGYDLSGEDNNSTLINGVGFNTNGYFEFDGTDGYITLASTITNSIYTLNFLYKMGVNDGGYGYFANVSGGKGLAISEGGTAVGLSYGNFYYLNGGAVKMIQSTLLTTGVWNNISVVIDTSAGNIKIYLNSNLVTNQSVSNMSTTVSEIGRYIPSNNNFLNGDMASYKIYNREITIPEIKQNYYQAPIVTDGLVFALDAGNLPSYESSSLTTYSLTGSQSGTLTNGVGYSNNNGGKWVFDGADDYIDLGSITSANPLSLYGLNEFTIEFWIKANGTGDGFQRIIDKSTAGGSANGWAIYFGTNASDNYITLASIGSNLITDTSPRDFGNWVHYVFTKNGDDYGLWMNGELKQTNTNTTVIPSTTANCRIGSWNHSTGRELNGEIAIFRMYDKTLTIDEVRGNFESQRNRFTKYSSPFKMTVTTTTINEDFTLPFTSVGQYNCVVDWGDGSSNEIIVYNDAALTHTYASAQDHQITISGVFGGVSFLGSNTTMRLKLKSIDQWGTNQWKKMATAFYYCRNVVITAGDAPNLGDITSLSQMFYFNSALTGDLSNWDVSNINDFYFMFRDCSSFNSDLSNWDVNNVISIRYMFYGCSSFNSDLSNWDVSNVTNFFNMFFGCSSFNGGVSNWDVSNATNMGGMFRGCINFNQDISSWDVSSVTNFNTMLESCRIFNQDISSWNVSSGVDMASMLGNCWALNQDLSYWERSTVGDVSTVGNVTSMSSLFYRNYAFNSDLSNWDVSSVTTMYHMFRDITAHSLGDVSNWDVSNVTNMGLMFYNCQLFESDISNWNVTSTLTAMQSMFTNCYKFNSDLSNWNVSSVTNFNNTFKNTLIFNRPLSNWERSTVGDVSTVGNVTNMNGMFYNSAFNQDIGGWDVSNVADFTNFMGLKTPSNFSSANLDAIYNGWSLLTLSPNEVITFGTAKYNASAQNGRDTLTSSPNNWTITDGGLTPALFITATGGTITTDGDFKVHSFNSSSTFTVTSLGTDSTYGDVVDYLVVAGGGGGGARAGGGGGAGGLLEASNYTVSATAYTVTIGAGGAGRASARGRGNAGNNSLFGAVTSTGGGFGGGAANNENPGGSGGSGGGSHNNAAVGTGTTGQGNNGGIGDGGTGGGGGGAGAVGGNHSGSTGGNGGNGLQSNISGTNPYYAGGGGGGDNATPGTGGNGGGGAGSAGTANATPGTVNTGGGGGGSGYQSSNQGNGGNGGSGIVIVRYKFQ